MTRTAATWEPEHIPPFDPSTGRPPVSALQRALYLVELLHPGTPTYNIGVALRLRGPLDVSRLAGAITRVVARHDALRTTVVPDSTPPFEPTLHILDAALAADVAYLEMVELAPDPTDDGDAAALRAAQDSVDEPFDLATGPLLRTRLFTVGPDQHLLALTLHHLVSYGPSLQLFVDDLADAYGEPTQAGPPVLRFADYAAWQRARPLDDGQLAWWHDHLAGVPTVLRLPTDRPAPAVAGTHGRHHRHVLSEDVMGPVMRLARDLRVTPFAVVLSVYALFLGRLAQVPRVLVGVPVGARDRVELERVIGYFATTLPVLVELGEQSFAALCRAVQEELLDVVDHSDVTLEQLVRDLAPARDAASAPLVQTYFALEQTPVVSTRLPGLSVTPVDLLPTAAKVDLEMAIHLAAEGTERFDLTLTYRTDLFDAPTVARMVDDFERLLVDAVAAPDAGIGTLGPPVTFAPATAARPGPPEPSARPVPSATSVRPAPSVPPAPSGPATAERDRMRDLLLQIWREVLGRDYIGAGDNFFDIGGTSFALTTVHTLLVSRTATTTPLVTLLEFPTVDALAHHLGGGARPDHPTGAPAGPARSTRLRDRRERLRRTRTDRGAAR